VHLEDHARYRDVLLSFLQHVDAATGSSSTTA